MSTDPAHSLADAFGVPLGDAATQVTDNLFAEQIDAQQRLEESWGEVRDHLTDLFDWSGLKGIEAEELSVFPGMDEVFALVSVRDHVRSAEYDVIVVDCAPTAETLRLLSLPEVLSWYMEKMFPVGRRVAKVVRPVLSRVTTIPIADDKVFDAVARFYERLDGIREILGDPDVTSARLVMNPEKMVISEARRTYTYLGLFGYAVDAAIVNRVLPDTVTDPYFDRWREIQERHLADVEEGFADIAILRLRLFGEEMVGIDQLRVIGDELFGEDDPTVHLSKGRPFRVEDDGENVVLVLSVPFAEHGEVDVLRHGEELYVTVGPYRRSLILPDSLKRREVQRARLTGGELRITFGDRLIRSPDSGLPTNPMKGARTSPPSGSTSGGTKLLAVRLDGDAVVDERRSSNPSGRVPIVDALATAIGEVLTDDVDAIGVGIAGLVEWPEGIFVWGPHVAGIGLHLRSHLEEAFGLPDRGRQRRQRRRPRRAHQGLCPWLRPRRASSPWEPVSAAP